MATLTASLIVGYLALCVLGRIMYPRLLFPAPKIEGDAAALARGAGAELITLPHGQSVTHALWFQAPSPRAHVVVMFHGNGETVFSDLSIARHLVDRGLHVMLVEYRGYGTTYGPAPSEESLYEDGAAAIDWLRSAQNIDVSRIGLWGWSLGTSVAAEMAYRGLGSRLVLLAPFTSLPEMGRRVAPVLPVSLLLSHRLDTIGKAREIHVPTLVVHGEDDELIPIAMGQRVAETIPDGKMVRVARGHHMDLLSNDTGATPNADELYGILIAHLGGDGS